MTAKESAAAPKTEAASIDPRAVRVEPAVTSAHPDDPTLTVFPDAAEHRLEWLDATRAVLVQRIDDVERRTPVQLGPVASAAGGKSVREVVVGGWRFDLTVESALRADLRERSHRAGSASGGTGPLEVHAIIPGRIVAVHVAPGDAVTAGEQLLVLEAMKMQNELRAAREGSITRIAVAVGSNVEVGDLLLVIE